MTAGFHAPLPPARTGVADYAAALLSALRMHGSVEVDSTTADVHLYHLGNNSLHRETYEQALARPGVAVLHDAVLHHLLLGSLESGQYVEEFVYNYGEWHREFAMELWRARRLSGTDPRYFRYAMLRRIAETSRAVIVHNPAAAAIVRAHAAAARVFEIPHLFVEPALPSEWENTRLRRELGLRPHSALFGVFGYLRESKRLPVVLRVFERLRLELPEVSLLIAGEFASSDLARAVQPLLERTGILRMGYVPAPEFWQLAAATDVCINLRHPAAGETSGIGIRFMGIGKPVILSEGAENSRFPEAACLRVPAGVEEVEALASYMTWLAQFPDAAREIGRRAQAHIREHHSLERVADAYWEVLQTCRG